MGYNLDVKNMSNEDWLLTNCKERALYILSNYNKTEKQLRDKLKLSKKYNDKIIDATLVFLKKHNYINDYDYTKRFIEVKSKNYSLKVIKTKLYNKGIDNNIIENVLENVNFKLDDEELITKILFKKYPNYYDDKDSMDIKLKQKIFAYLIRKGFSYDKVLNVLNIEN